MEACLKAVVHGQSSEPLVVVYSDMHGLWGGVTITLAADGEYEQTERAPGGKPQVRRGSVAGERVRELGQLLLDQQAWQQRVPDRAPVPDESRATLTVRCGKSETVIWEWYNDLAANGRLALIRDRLLAIGREFASQPAPS